MHRLTVATHDAGREVDLQPRQHKARLLLPAPRAAQRRMQPGDELAGAERLGDVVVRAGLQRQDLLLLLAHR